MSLRESQRAELEERYPEKFTDGQIFIDLAKRGRDLYAAKFWDSGTWTAATGQERPHGERGLWAPALFELFQPYEAERMAARWLSGVGVEAMKMYQRELNDEARVARDPIAVLRFKIGQWFADQADRDPDRRKPFTQAIRDLDLTVSVSKPIKTAKFNV